METYDPLPREVQLENIRLKLREAPTTKAKLDVYYSFVEDISYGLDVLKEACALEEFDKDNAWRV